MGRVALMMAIVVNGKRRALASSLTVADYLAELGLEGGQVAVARNGEVLDRDKLGAVLLREGDQIEIVRAIGGG